MRFVKLNEIELETGIESPLYIELDCIEYIEENFSSYFDGEEYKQYSVLGLKSGKSFCVKQGAKQIFALAKEDKERAMQNKSDTRRF